MTTKSLFFGALTASMLLGGTAGAAVVGIDSDCGGTGSELTQAGTITCSGAADRLDTGNIEVFENGIGSGDNDFFSLGLNGSLVLEFDPVITGAATVIEITNGGGSSSHKEAVRIFGSNDGINFDILGTADNQGGIDDGTRGTTSTVSFAGTYSFLGFVDISKSTFAGTASSDGFDIDAIVVTSVSAVPLPASALLLLGGVAGLGAMRSRRKS
ncbi:VPLPA-CTERM sorting domain-containing protein [uncultured Roseobacter sp.]|uniref:VPLPA-CTERM sorting domain-containing protein n=1 Tax=uncultured Roseobacter sp. TaxID=114847 RepID=UPI0026183F4F|nr:VPLPA-CTERM sorting domain-containing protein [uncultured Roseobacter sp.]